MAKKKKGWHDVLRYNHKRGRSQSTLKRYYNIWRKENGLPLERCDNSECLFYTQPLKWNGKPLSLILDHINGNSHDNSPPNLRYLCPNCDSQLPTKGGRNKGRVVELLVEGYALLDAVRQALEHFRFVPQDQIGINDRVVIKVVPPNQEQQPS